MQVLNVILSGGVGSRLWPLSRKSRPKQYLPIFEGQTLFQKTVQRNIQFCDRIVVVGNRDNYLLSQKDLEVAKIKDFTEIIEACPRNTAAAIAFAAFSANPEDVLFITPSDHLISSDENYKIAVFRAIQLAKEGYVVTFGLKPASPETGFGYIEAFGEEVKSFREKPDLATAVGFLEMGYFFWNSGMFCIRAAIYLEELKKFEPQIFNSSKKAFENSKSGKLDFELSMEIPSISVDFAVMERTKKIKMVNSHFEWSDMGSFGSIYAYLEKTSYPKDDFGNMVIGTEIHTEFIGLTNTILIQTSDAILVLQKEKAQEVKKIYERLEKEKSELI